MMLDGAESLDGMRQALKETPRLRGLLKKLVG